MFHTTVIDNESIMKRPLKAVLLSLFVLPGAGHYFLNHKKIASALMVISLGLLLSIFMKCVSIINDLVVDISTGKIAFDIVVINEAVHLKLGQSMGDIITVFLILWVLSAVDSYRRGILIEAAEKV
jgi:hypothetical protein